ncbi:uncharacterized protein L3040_008313 [Drepanopeziza brunnea f. sp. 'multigermtubi']|uniref:N-acetyltransferase domain-containing protein n=1 Tax=Marssonina brunnea f. sp. multigermtubi (strain MB_m1) TaxID=1072389 RepID=K1XPA5_MARBU|nr:uncharacterized protein MBM_07564 [Drepanopeziza brunnea f. sp. 'multigermtubi' MB_m1]EKD14334.1 hypothetical protein MBM_07564 [Drepanopeziza brunnea f. sp. 'multigermtubi' MB_m1]KAJ5035051.1 hypothetical protein L3040_008313 [Drepanopeziza brunnea f. sp. 'multigermtubi']
MVRLSTQRLILRTPEPDEGFQYATINELWVHSPDHYAETMLKWQKLGALQLFLILARKARDGDLAVPEGEVIGFLQIAPADRNVVSYRIHHTLAQEGYMKEACEAAFDHWFKEMPMEFLYVEARTYNIAVMLMMEEFGLSAEVLRLEGPDASWTFGWTSWKFRGTRNTLL